jgi:hypothetical protein
MAGLRPATVHSLVSEVASTYLSAVDAALPGFVQGLYLTGSVALDDFYPAWSDIDFVAVSANSLAADALLLIHRN